MNKNELKNQDNAELDFYVLSQQNSIRLLNSDSVYKIFSESAPSESSESIFSLLPPKHTGRFHMTFDTVVTEKMVGKSDDDNTVYNTTWELLREEEHNGKKFLVFCGWTNQFNFYEIGVEKKLFANVIANLMSHYPDRYSISNMKKVIGLEGFIFEDGKMWI